MPLANAPDETVTQASELSTVFAVTSLNSRLAFVVYVSAM